MRPPRTPQMSGEWEFRLYRVCINDSPVGQIDEGETKDFFVPAGEHRVRLTIDKFWGSREARLQVRAGELAEFTCPPGGPGLCGRLSRGRTALPPGGVPPVGLVFAR